MTDQPHQESLREQAVRRALYGQMSTVAFVQYGPDGTTPVNAVQFYACPLCGVPIPIPMDERPDLVFPEWHVEHHLQIARLEDRMDELHYRLQHLEDGADA